MDTKQCVGCSHVLPTTSFAKDKYRKDGLRYKCRSCSAKEFVAFRASEGYIKRLAKSKTQRRASKIKTPVAHWARIAFYNAKQRAKVMGVPFTITKEWLCDHAPIVCPLLEITLLYGADKSADNVASVDRKDSRGGYTPDNCCIISFKANRMKNNATVAELELLVKNMRNY